MDIFAKPVENFYKSVIALLNKNHIPFLLGGGLAAQEYTNQEINRPMKDMDLLCKAGDYPKILTIFKNEGFRVIIPDEQWLAKIIKNKHHADLIFSSPNYINPVDDSWFRYARQVKLFGETIKMLAPEELIWCKAYVQDREHYDGADINHIILNQGKDLNWKRLLMRMENHWDLLLSILINFRFVYPSERRNIPKSLMEELVLRLQNQLSNPIPKDKICRGPLISRNDYKKDILNGKYRSIS